jgi:hypothetical protein
MARIKTGSAMSIRRRGKHAYQVRVAPFAAKTVQTRRDAELVEAAFKQRRAMGELYTERATTLGEEIDSFLTRVRAGGRSPRTIEFYERSARIWTPFRGTAVNALRRRAIEDFIMGRAATQPRSAKNELEFLKRVLNEAKGRGQMIDAAVLAIPAIKHEARRGQALTVSELYELAAWFPEYAQRLVLAAGQVGARQNVWFNLTDDLLDLKAGSRRTARNTASTSPRSRRTFCESSCLRELQEHGSFFRRRRGCSGRGAASGSVYGCRR